MGRLADDTLERLARETGAYLAELHSVPAVDGFGHLRHDSPALAGDRPSGDPEVLTVGDPHDNWLTHLGEYAGEELDHHDDSRFSELAPDLRRWVRVGIENLKGSVEPVLGPNDHGLYNLLVDPEMGEITAMLD